MTDLDIARRYLPIIHLDRAETIPLRAIGYTVFRTGERSASFPRRIVEVPENAAFTVEYACYWDYDIQHMYDLEHLWVTVGRDGRVLGAQGSFHGRYLTLFDPELPCLPPDGDRVHAFCQPGKHAFLPDGQLFRLLPDWQTCCTRDAGGGVLVGGPFEGVYAPTAEDDARSARYIREHLAFSPTLDFSARVPDDVPLLPWPELFCWIPFYVTAECERLKSLDANP